VAAVFLVDAAQASPAAAESGRYTAGPANCAYSLELIDGEPGHRTLALHGPMMCVPRLEDEVAAITELLTKLHQDGKSLTDFSVFGLGRVRPGPWQERMADCYIAKFGADDREFHKVGLNNVDLFKKCSIFPELERVFAKQGARIHLDAIEKLEWVVLADLAAHPGSALSPAWVQGHSRHKGRVPLGGLIYFQIEPAASGIPVK